MSRVAGRTAGWFADPAGRFRFRYWTGDEWTDQVLDGKSREESTDVLEAHLRSQEPRPALPSLPQPGVGDRTDAGPTVYSGAAVVVDDIAISKAWRIPRPSRMLVVVVAAAFVAGVTIWVVGRADDAAKPGAVPNLIPNVVSAPPDAENPLFPSQQPALQGSAGVSFSDDPAPTGYHRTEVEGLSVPIPVTWLAINPSTPLFQNELARVGVPETPAERERLRLFVESYDSPLTMTVATSPIDRGMLDQPKALESVVRQVPGVAPDSVKVTRVRVANHDGLRLDNVLTTTLPNGTAFTAYEQSYLVPSGSGGLEIQFIASTDHSADPTIATIMSHVRSAG